MARIEFDPESSEAQKAIVVSFDLCGFSDFCNQADAYADLPRFLSALFDEVNKSFLHWSEGRLFQLDFNEDRVSPPHFIKYTGDGALMIWLVPKDLQDPQGFSTAVVRAMRNLQNRFTEIIPQWAIAWQVHSLPARARFGIATGFVHPLRGKSPTLLSPGSIEDYAGYCINLAVRLQNHCPEIGFLVHEPVLPQLKGLIKLIAHGMKGMRPEPVLMFGTDLHMTVDHVKSKFLPAGDEAEARSRATLREPNFVYGSEDNAPLNQPRFEAHFMTGTFVNCTMFLSEIRAEFIFLWDNKDASGKVVGQKEVHFRLQSKGPPAIYKLVSSVPYIPPKV